MDPLKLGKAVYVRRCVSCHGPDGSGKIGSRQFAADLRQANGVLLKSNEALGKSIMEGLRTPLGRMPAHKAVVSEEELAAVLRYVREKLGDQVPLLNSP